MRTRDTLLLVIIFAIGILSRLPAVIFPPALRYYEPLEYEVLTCVLGLFAGLAPAGITFSALGVYGIPLLGLYSADFLFTQPDALGAVLHRQPPILLHALSSYIAQAVISPDRHLMIGRALIMLISAFGPLAAAWLFLRNGLRAGAWCAAALMLASPFLYVYSVSLMPDAAAAAFFLLSLMLVANTNTWSARRAAAAGALISLAVAGKLLYAPFILVALIAVGWRFSGYCIGGLLLMQLAIVPFIWTSPLAFLRNSVGTTATFYQGKYDTLQKLFTVILPAFAHPLAWIFSLGGIAAAFKIFGRRTAMILASSFLLLSLPFLVSRNPLPRYAFPIGLFLCIFAGASVEWLWRRQRLRVVTAGCALCVILVTAWGTVREVSALHRSTPASECIGWVHSVFPSGTRIGIPESMHLLFTPNGEYLALRKENAASSLADVNKRLAHLYSLAGIRTDARSAHSPLEPAVFALAEKKAVFFNDLLLWYYRQVRTPEPAYFLTVYEEKEFIPGWLAVPAAQLQEALDRGEIDVLIDDGKNRFVLPAETAYGTKRFGPYTVYVFQAR